MTAGIVDLRRRFCGLFSGKLLRNDRGSVLVEFAMAVPVLSLLLLGGVELGRYVLLNQKLDRAVMTLSDLVASTTSVSISDVDQIFNATSLVLDPFPLGAQGAVVISSVKSDSGTPKIFWQRTGGGSLSVTSTIGVQAGDATLSNNNLVTNTEGVIIGEIFYEYQPWFTDLIPNSIIRHQAVFRPRQSNEVVCTDCPGPTP
jgi:Flp pilus assembly protein TadG